MSILEVKIVQDFIRTCSDGWDLGFHERNGGNLTYRMKEEEVGECKEYFNQSGDWVDMGVCGKNLAGSRFMTTGSGKFFRNVSLSPEESMGIVEINEQGTSYRIVWGLLNKAKPTSEFPTHYMNHCVRVSKTKDTEAECRVIYHAHPKNLIAMTYVLPLTARDFSRVLWQSATECVVVFPMGVGVVPWMVPGGSEIANATSKVMEDFEAAVWAHHGMFCSGCDFDITMGLMHTIEKSAEIWCIAMAAGGGKLLQTIQDHELKAIADDFKVKMNEDFITLL